MKKQDGAKHQIDEKYVPKGYGAPKQHLEPNDTVSCLVVPNTCIQMRESHSRNYKEKFLVLMIMKVRNTPCNNIKIS